MKRTSLLILIFMVLAATPFKLMAQSEKEPPPPDGKILYVDTSEKDKTFLATINPDGTGKTRLTPAYSNIVFPKFSPASGWIGFTNKTPDMKSEVYLLSSDGQKIKKIFDGVALEGFSPNGKFLLYTTCDQEAALFAYSIESKQSTKLSQNLKVTAAEYSPQGDWIAVSALTDDGTSDLYLISTQAQGVVRVTQTQGVDESFPVFTKDGKNLVFISTRYGKNEIEYLDLEKRSFHRPILMGLYPSLSPSNNWVGYQIGEMLCIARSNGIDLKTLGPGRTPCWIK